MRKALFIVTLLIVVASFSINLFIENSSLQTIINMTGLVAILLLAIFTRNRTTSIKKH
ncbi:hypothetical protein [Pseudalkalibacillus sp. NRS-1564]|uniref:hypothetical protein n=1 Tax=Pseudalkalibacillus sp. NRS-1564 TaxID=3233900 RepID=UPI003D2BC030